MMTIKPSPDAHPPETQQSVTDWAEHTFGPVTNPTVLVDRAKLEMDELMLAVETGDFSAVEQELADVLILLYRLATLHGFSFEAAVTRKMAINRARKWLPKGDGTGRHIG